MSGALLALVADPPTNALANALANRKSGATPGATRTQPTPSHRLRVGVAPSPWPVPRPDPASLQPRGEAARQGELDLELVLSSGFGGAPRPALVRVDRNPGTTGNPGPRRTLGGARNAGEDEDDDFTSRRPTPTRDLPDPMAWSARLAQAIAEIRTGLRPPQQLTRWATRSVMDELRRSHASARDRTPTTVRVRSVHAGQPADGVVEATAVVTRGSRSRALALRLEGWDGKWVCVSADVV